MTKYGGCLHSEEDLDFDEIQLRLSKVGFTIRPIQDCIEGGTYLARVAEAIVGPNDGEVFVDDLIAQFVQDVGSTASFTIIDPYLLPKCDDPAKYARRLANILSPSIPHITELCLIVSKADSHVQSELESIIASLNSQVKIRVLKTELFHDRYWFGDNDKGFIVGTSLNGIAKKISLIDWINPQDLSDIRSELASLRLT